LREFQDAGHTAVLIIGDYTAQVGDPTDRSEARKMLSEAEVKQNAEGYLDQAFKILDKDKTEVHYQTEWFGKFTLRSVIELLASTTLNHLLSHETFGNRIRENQPLHAHEMLYPLLQGYDSVAIESDIELGGVDQKFNVLMGRTLQKAHGQPEQDVMLMDYLPGTDGNAKMSKSLGNTINLTDSADDMFGKTMSIPDELIPLYFEFATNVPMEKVDEVKAKMGDASTNPRDLKLELAEAIVSEFHSPEAAKKAHEHFLQVFSRKELPTDIETLHIAPGEYDLFDILVTKSTLVASKSEVRRLVAQNGIRKNNQVVQDVEETISPKDGAEVVLQVGPRRFLKVVWKS
jgi:tyrosyl-tRNA synthetase